MLNANNAPHHAPYIPPSSHCSIKRDGTRKVDHPFKSVPLENFHTAPLSPHHSIFINIYTLCIFYVFVHLIPINASKCNRNDAPPIHKPQQSTLCSFTPTATSRYARQLYYMSAAKVHFIYDGIYNRRPLAYLPIRPTLCVVAILAKRWAVARTARHE